MAKVLLINPPQVYRITQIASGAVPPIGAAYLAAYLRENGHQVQFIDALGSGMDIFNKRGEATLRGLTLNTIVDRIPEGMDVIGVTNLFSHAWPVVQELLVMIKARFPQLPLVTGGVNQTAIPDYLLDNGAMDYIVLGEGEITFLKLIERLSKNQTVDDLSGLAYRQNSRSVINEKQQTDLIQDLDILPFPAYDLLPIENYIKAKSPHGASRGRSLQMIATRGCPYNCTFCTAPKMWLPQWRSRSPKNVVDEMKQWNREYGINDFHFEDLTMIFDRPWAIEFADEVVKQDLDITWQMPNGTRSEIFDDEVIEKLKASGCSNVAFAPESGCPRTLSLIEKSLELEDIVNGSRRLIKQGYIVCAFFCIGFPHDTMEDIKNSFKFMRKLAWIGVHEISITTFTALPGSKLFYQLRSEGKIKLTETFFNELLYMSDLSKAATWIEGISAARIAHLRRLGYFYFFSVSYLRRPWRFIMTFINILRGVEKTKVERIGHAKLSDGRKLALNAFRKRRDKLHKAAG